MANRAPDFFRNLTEQLLEQLEEVARQPGVKGDEVLAWLEAHGVKTSRSAVYRWLQDFRLEDRTRRASEVARSYLDAAREADPQAVSEASLKKFEELVFDYLVGAEAADAKDLMFIASAMRTGLGSRKELLDLRKKVSDLQAAQQAAVEAAEKAAAGGGGSDAVIRLIKTKLGIIQPGRPA
jgi:hypothetical protein